MLNATIKINDDGLHVAYCANCGNQLNYREFGGYDYCKSRKFNCKRCSSPCTGLKHQSEVGFYERTVKGYCKQCNTRIEYTP